MSSTNVPPILAALRDRLLASSVLAQLVADGAVGFTDSTPWVFLDYAEDGSALDADDNLTSITLYVRAAQWMTATSSARFPTVGVDVITTGEPKSSGARWQSRAVAEALIDWLDDPAHERQVGDWGHGVWVSSIRWDGSLSSAEVENVDGTYRSEFSLEFQLV